MEFEPEDTISTIWFAENVKGNIMITLKKCSVDNCYKGEYRFRWFKDGQQDPFSGNDDKSFYQVVIPKDKNEQESKEVLTRIFDIYTRQFDCSVVDIVVINGDQSKMLEILSKKSWCNIRKVPTNPA